MASSKYEPRIVDTVLAERLESAGTVVIEGAKACGKTQTARQVAASEIRLDVDENARLAAAVTPEIVLEGPTPRLIDEWQVEPRIWGHMRNAVDERNEPGQFILTGSAAPTDDETRHTGTGRISRLQMRPMSLLETGVSTGGISLKALLAGEASSSPDAGLDIQGLAEAIVRGGWPGSLRLELKPAMQRVRDYLAEVSRTDIRTVDGVRRDPEKVNRVIRSLARNVATQVTQTTLAADAGGDDGPIDNATVADYLSALNRLFVIEDQPAWASHLRSRYVLRRAPKRHFVCPSIAVAALRTSPGPLLRDLNLFGLLFESLAIRDLRIHGQPLEATVSHYRDSSDLEVDAIVSTPEGPWAAFEIKLGGETLIEEGAESLLTFAERVDTKKAGNPAVLAVIVGSGYGYVREDGVHVIPIGALGP